MAATRCLMPGMPAANLDVGAVEEFKKWMLMQFDTNHDGRISRRELREALHSRGAWFPTLKAWGTLHRADSNRNGFVDDSEMKNLIQFAEKELGFKRSMVD